MPSWSTPEAAVRSNYGSLDLHEVLAKTFGSLSIQCTTSKQEINRTGHTCTLLGAHVHYDGFDPCTMYTLPPDRQFELVFNDAE